MWEDEIAYGNGEEGVYNYLERAPGYVIIVPISSKGEVFFVKNWRHPIKKEIYQLPMGYINKGEIPTQAAKREAKEEIGLKSAKWKNLGWVWQAAGILRLKAHIFLAQDVTLGRASPGRDESLNLVKKKGSLKKLISGLDLNDSSTLIALYKSVEYLSKNSK